MNNLIIKTKIKNYIDYRTISAGEDFPEFTLDSVKLDKDIKRIQHAMGKKEYAEEVAEGDLVLVSCHSELPHYEKEDIYVIVGKNLYSSELEAKLVGLQKGQSEIQLEDGRVQVEIKSIERTTVPELNDENVKNWGIEGVSTVEELKKHFFGRQVANFKDEDEDADMAFSKFCMTIMDKCTFEQDEEELAIVKKTVAVQIERAKSGMEDMENEADFDAEEQQESEEDIDFDNLEEMMISGTLNAAALGYRLAQENDMLFTMDDYEKELEIRSKAYKLSKEEAAKKFTVTDCAVELYSEYYYNTIEKYFGEIMVDYYYENRKLEMYDVAIIGAGPGGLSAALTLKLHNKTIAWFGSPELSNKIEKSEKIANYAGFAPLSGAELNQNFKDQIKASKLQLIDKMVTQINSYKGQFMVLADNEIYNAKTVLLAIGSVPAKGIINEQEMLGRGVSYCATCDGFLYRGKTIAVLCGSKRYEHEVEYLAEMAEKVYVYATYEDAHFDAANIEVLKKPMKAVYGEMKVNSVELSDGTKLDVDGTFFLRSAVAPATILRGLEMDGAHIVVDRNCNTNIKGCFAAGDCTGRPYQIAKAVGEGNVAAHQIVEYLSEGK